MGSTGRVRSARTRTGLIDLPFPARRHPRHERAGRHTLDWLHRFGMLAGEQATAEYDAMGLERLMAYFYPDASDAHLALATDLNAWFFVFDDQFDGPLGKSPDGVLRQVDTVLRTMGDAPPVPGEVTNRLAESFRDLWQRVTADTPLLWQDRFRAHWRAYLTAYHWEALNRTRSGTLSLPGFLRGRRDSIGVQPCLDLVERCGGYTLPKELHEGEPLAEMREITADVVIFVNDMVSVDKELAAGDVNNSVIILLRQEMCTVEQALRRVAALANARVARFQELTVELGASLDATGLAKELRWQVDDYVDGMRALMSGNLAWSRETARYGEAGIAAVSEGRQRPWAQLFPEQAAEG
ncbi:isoafricanol synthase [Streptomyces sp. NBC_00083]|uniref:isoafricanol synthase n=1 Tax=Streptomyces sp. NBC_00083 TaxID=2975647 RepID=UPI002254FE8F|nr:isoafricanol synthase [Streptomyces sp. NBC_00083]MCX5384002.1 pentalenene synthase [Streptomyces sp. NBC_00083]